MGKVIVAKDVVKRENKLLFNLTKRQIVCFLIAALVAMPVFLATKGFLGDFALYLAAFLGFPFLAAGFYRPKDGRPLEKVLLNFIEVKFKQPQVRYWQNDNIYNCIETLDKIEAVINNARKTEEVDGGCGDGEKAHQATRSIRRFTKGR